MTKFIQAFLTGAFFTFFLDFFLFLGIKETYTDYYNIQVYYNILFADNQNSFIYLTLTAIIGYIIIYLNNAKLALIVVGTLFTLACATLIQPFGHAVAQMILMKENITLKSGKHTFNGDIYYDGRSEITFYDYELKKIITLKKKDLK